MFFNPGLKSNWTVWRVNKGAQRREREIESREKRITNLAVTAFPCFEETHEQ